MPPNIVYLHSHDSGRHVQPMGHAVPTPHLQRLAEEGVLFRQCFCAAPTCSPSRAALLTGQCAHSSGMLGLAHRGFALREPGQHLAATLQAAGYHAVLAGVQHVAVRARDTGYAQELVPASRGADDVSVAAAAFLGGRPRQPFFLDVGTTETHLTFPKVPEDRSRYLRVPDPQPDTPEIRRMTAGFHESLRCLDAGHGRVLEALARNGLADDTLVICTTDHGPAFPGMKCHLTDHGIGVFLIVRGPGGFGGGRVCDALVSHLDLFPTVCEVAGVEAPAHLQGTSLLPWVRGQAEAVRDEVFAEVTYHAAYEPQRAVRTPRWKLIRRYDEEMDTPVLPNCDDSEAKQVWLEHGWAQRQLDREQLYDLALDPQERYNLAADPACAEVLARLRGRLHSWMEATADPLLAGPVPAPPGAKVNDKRGASPREPPAVVH